MLGCQPQGNACQPGIQGEPHLPQELLDCPGVSDTWPPFPATCGA